MSFADQWRQTIKRLMAFEKRTLTSFPKNRSTQLKIKRFRNRRRPPRQLMSSRLLYREFTFTVNLKGLLEESATEFFGAAKKRSGVQFMGQIGNSATRPYSTQLRGAAGATAHSETKTGQTPVALEPTR